MAPADIDALLQKVMDLPAASGREQVIAAFGQALDAAVFSSRQAARGAAPGSHAATAAGAAKSARMLLQVIKSRGWLR
jgi:hypothetical protein